MVFHPTRWFSHLTVAENILFGLSCGRKVPAVRAPAPPRQDGGPLLGLDHLLSASRRSFSGRPALRVALGRAIIAEAPLCLMDEPLSQSRRPAASTRCGARIRTLQQRLGMTMIYVTHDQ